ncbi:MAG: hypothetical protein A2Z47_08285 [Thermodesulfovibrio sp. RBG_19FT_COMBO_42_12]|nr:MAG: hypothetical protein A2Z47_08285 [Thermodesulfovibrio sp. RBG_19FT_COMBO_42_12]
MDNNLDKKKKPFSFRLSKEKLKEFLGFSAEAKLEWLEGVNKFVNKLKPRHHGVLNPWVGRGL